MLTIPLEAGLHQIGVCSTYILGLQIGTQFCPGMIYRSCRRHVMARQIRVQVGFKIEFFCRLKCTRTVYPGEFRGWFFDIYIQGSKKIQL